MKKKTEHHELNMIDYLRRCVDHRIELSPRAAEMLSKLPYPDCDHEMKCSKCGKKT